MSSQREMQWIVFLPGRGTEGQGGISIPGKSWGVISGSEEMSGYNGFIGLG